MVLSCYFTAGYGRVSRAFLAYYPNQNTIKKIRRVKFTERLDHVDESVELLPASAKPEPEKPIHENEVANVRRYPIRDRVRPKYLDDYVTGKDLDDAVDAMLQIVQLIFATEQPMFPSLTKMQSHSQILVIVP